MKKITLTKLTIRNFRALQYFSGDFTKRTYIKGRNESGKSTIYNAFLWLISGYDDKGRFNYELLDTRIAPNKDDPRLVEVEGLFDVDGIEYTFTRRMKESFIKERATKEVKQSTPIYEYARDGVEISATEFANAIEEVFTPYENIRLLSDVSYFLNKREAEQRQILLSLVQNIPYEEIMKEFPAVMEQHSKYSLEAMEDLARAKRNTLSTRDKAIPAIIEDLDENMPETPDVEALYAGITDKEAKMKEIDDEIAAKGTAEEKIMEERDRTLSQLATKENDLRGLRQRYEDARQKSMSAITAKMQQAKSTNDEIDRNNRIKEESVQHIKAEIADCKSQIDIMERNRNSILGEYHIESEKVFSETKCTACGQDLPMERIEELRDRFNVSKETKLKEIKERGLANTQRRDAAKQRLEKLQNDLANAPAKTEPVSMGDLQAERDKAILAYPQFENTQDYIDKKREIDDLKAMISAVPERRDIIELQEKRAVLEGERNELKKKFDVREQIAEIKKHKAELIAEQAKIGDELGKCDMILEQVAGFRQRCSEIMSANVQGLFKTCEVQITRLNKSGKEEQCCFITQKGTPYPVCSFSQQIRMGIEVIEMLSEHYGVKFPLWIDNAGELDELPDYFDGEMIGLFVDKNKDKIEITNRPY